MKVCINNYLDSKRGLQRKLVDLLGYKQWKINNRQIYVKAKEYTKIEAASLNCFLENCF